MIRFPLTRWLLQDNYTQPWWNGETEVASMPWWETEGNGTQMDEWSSRRTEFYLNMMRYILRNESDVNITAFEQSWLSQDLAEDFYLHDVFCDTIPLPVCRAPVTWARAAQRPPQRAETPRLPRSSPSAP